MQLLFTLDQQLIVSSAALLTSLILVSRENLLQARLLSVALSVTTFSMALVQVQSVGMAILCWFLPCLQASFPVLLTLLLPPCRRAVLTTCLRKDRHRITKPLQVPQLVVLPESGFDSVNEEANVRTNAAVVDGHADVRA